LFGEGLSGDELLGEDSEDSHHGGTSVVELSILLTEFLGRFLLPVVDLSESDTVVSIEFGRWPPCELNKSHEDENLQKSGGWDLEESSDTVIDVGELESGGRGKVSVESPLVVVDEGSEHGHHGDTSVLTLDGAVAFELGFVGDVSKRIEESKRSGGSDLG